MSANEVTGQSQERPIEGLGRRELLRAVTAVGITGASIAGLSLVGETGATAVPEMGDVLQPSSGPIRGQHYLPSLPDQVRWGYLPSLTSEPLLRIRSGQTVTIDTVSHEGILEDQGRDPVTFFAGHGVPARQVLSDAIAIARDYRRTTRNFDVDGPHVVTGPVFVDGAQPGDVLKVEMIEMIPRVPYGVVSSRHGKGALPRLAGGAVPAGITLEEIMPPVATDGRATGDPTSYGNVSIFTPVRRGRHGDLSGVVPRGASAEVSFPLHPFMGLVGVAFAAADGLTAPELNSIPPTLGGGNIDISWLGVGATLFLPVFAEGALFFVGDPHLAMGDGEVALTAMEGSLRATFRLTVCKPGSSHIPSVAFRYPFAEPHRPGSP